MSGTRARLLVAIAAVAVMTAPVFAGDTLYAESEVIAKRESQSRPTQGIVTVRTRGTNQDGKVVISYERTVLVPKRGHGVEDSAS